MLPFKKNDIHIDLTLMKDHFQSEEEKDDFLEWFTLALSNARITNQLRSVETCYICNEFVTLKSTGKKIPRFEFRIPYGGPDLIVRSAILHLVSVHNLIPDKIVIEALEKLKPRN